MKRGTLLRATALATSVAMPMIGHCATTVTYVGAAYGSSNSWWGPVTISVPAGTQNGDLMLAYIATQSTDGSWVTAPAGWRQVIKTFNSVQGSQLFWRVANNEPTSYTWSNTSYPQGVIRTYRGADATAPVGVSAGCTSSGDLSCQIPALTETSVSGERYVGFWDFNLVSESIAGPSDLGNVTRNLTQRSMFSGDKSLTATGSTTIPAETATVTGTASHWEGIAVTVKPAASNSVATSPTPPAPTGSTGVAASSANDFLNSLGVCSSPDMSLASDIKYLGVRNLRGGSFEGGYTAADIIALAQATNTKTEWGPQTGFSGNSLSPDIAAAKAVANAGVLLAIEGPNEPDNFPVTYRGQVGGGNGTWIPVANLQRDLYAAVKADPVLKNYPVFNLTHGGSEKDNVGVQFLTIPTGSGTAMPDGTKYADYASMHNYVIWVNATAPKDNAAWASADPINHVPPAQISLVDDYGVTWAHHYNGYNATQLQALPRVTTETGWWASAGGEDNQGKTLLNVYLAQFKRGYKYTFLYEIKDRWSEQFGLFRADNSPRPAATYIHNLTTILNDNKSVASTPGKLNYSIASEPATVHDLLLQKSNGAFELVVWDERPVGEATDKVTVSLGGTHGSVNIYDVTAGVAPVQTLTNVSSVPLSLTDHPLILEILN